MVSEDGESTVEFTPERELFERDVEMMARGGKWPPIARRVGDVMVVNLLGLGGFPEVPPHRKVLLLSLLLTLKDRATLIRFEPWRTDDAGERETELFMIYDVDGQSHELPHSPACLADLVFRDLRELAGLNAPRRRAAELIRRLADWMDRQPRTPRRGKFRLDYRGGNAEFEVLVHDSDHGDRYFLTPIQTTGGAAEAAQEELKRLLRTMATRRQSKGQRPGS